MKMSRNRWLICGATAAVSLMAVVASVATANAATPHHASGKPAAQVAPVPQASSSGSSDQRRMGAVIPTGLDAGKGGDWVIYGVSAKDAQLPGTTFGFMIGQRRNGTVTPTTETNEIQGSDLALGFHATEGSMTVDPGGVEPTFGYYVGHPAKITVQAGGRTVVASTAVWSHNRSVTVFWFDTDKVNGSTTPSHLAAYDSAGHRLPQGNAEIGIG